MGQLNEIERVFSHSAETSQDTLPSLWGPNQAKLQAFKQTRNQSQVIVEGQHETAVLCLEGVVQSLSCTPIWLKLKLVQEGWNNSYFSI